MARHIVYTRHDGGVDVCTPGAETLAHMIHGGGWAHFPHYDEAEQIHLQVLDGIREAHAVRFARAIIRGGLSEREAVEVIRDRDCARRGHSFDLVLTEDLPADRWFRDAWRQGHNGGPPLIDLEKARPVQLKKIKAAVAERNKNRVALGRNPIAPQWWSLGKAIRHARDADELRRIWPNNLPVIFANQPTGLALQGAE